MNEKLRYFLNKRGLSVDGMMGALIIAAIVLAILISSYIILSGKGLAYIDSIKRILSGN